MLIAFRRAGGALCFGLVAAVIAALSAHLVIDAVGDVALARDSYDMLAHRSRDLAALALLSALVALGLRFVFAALDGSASRRRIIYSLAPPRSRIAFIIAVCIAATAMLIAMESWDAFAATGTLNSLADALGGSPLLGLSLTLALSMALGWLAWRALSWLASCSDALLRAIGAWFAILIAAMSPATPHCVPVTLCMRRRKTVLRNAAKRGPPLFLFA
jgi:hypothetical protein